MKEKIIELMDEYGIDIEDWNEFADDMLILVNKGVSSSLHCKINAYDKGYCKNYRCDAKCLDCDYRQI